MINNLLKNNKKPVDIGLSIHIISLYKNRGNNGN
jgi:hypothetical protein